MAYNHGREDRKWRIWKEAEEKLLRECGVDEVTIEQIRIADRADFNSNRRFYRWTNDVAEYLEDMADRERQAESWLHNKSAWKDLHGIGVIYCTIEKNGVVSKQSHYFIYSCVGLNAKQIMKYKRNHWTVENNLHWVLDMAFREDESRARKDNSAENFNVIRQIAFNILKSEKTFKGGITDKQFQCLLDSSYLDTIVMNWLCS